MHLLLYRYTTCREIYDPKHAYEFTALCVVTGKPYTVTIDGPALHRLRQGDKVQDACPHMSPDDREFIMSCISPAGWKTMFGE